MSGGDETEEESIEVRLRLLGRLPQHDAREVVTDGEVGRLGRDQFV